MDNPSPLSKRFIMETPKFLRLQITNVDVEDMCSWVKETSADERKHLLVNEYDLDNPMCNTIQVVEKDAAEYFGITGEEWIGLETVSYDEELGLVW